MIVISNKFHSSPSGEVVKTKAQGLCTDKGGEGKEKYSIILNSFNSSTDNKEHSVEVKRENESFSVPQKKQSSPSSVDDSIENTPIYIGIQKQDKTILSPNLLKQGEKNERTKKH